MSVTSNLTILNQYRDHLQPAYSNFPRGRYVSLLIIRKTESETIFRTEGSGEGLVKEIVVAGINNDKPMRRVVISKRKQTAVERRTGRELLREHDLLKKAVVNKVEQLCALNTNAPCGKCIDCMLYGFAVGGGGAGRVWLRFVFFSVARLLPCAARLPFPGARRRLARVPPRQRARGRRAGPSSAQQSSRGVDSAARWRGLRVSVDRGGPCPGGD